MKAFLRFIPFLSLLLLSYNASAFNQQTTCPALAAIKAEGLSDADIASERPLSYVAFSLSMYETEELWAFMVGPLLTSSQSEALAKGQVVLSQMTSEGEVTEVEGVEVCKYETGDNFIEAYAVKAEFGANLQKFSHILKK